MVKKNVLEEIETKYAVEDIILSNGIRAWPLLRQALYFKIQNKELGYSNKLRTRNKRQLLTNLFYGFKNLFFLSKFDYVFFNNTEKRKLYNGLLFDIYADAWADKLGQNKSLFIEWATSSHLPKSKVHSQHIVSDLVLKSLEAFYKPTVKIRIKNEHLLKAIEKEFEIKLDYKNILKASLAQYKAYLFIFKIIKPKAVFVLSSFTKAGICYAVKKLNIPLYEYQHGYIGAGHPFYHAVKKFPDFYPDYLLSFGNSEKSKGYKTLIVDSQSIIPIGSLQLELAKKEPIPKKLIEIVKKYNKCFCVTLQAIKDESILKWIEKEARLHKDWLFIVRPKNNTFDLTHFVNQNNIKLLSEFSTYEVLKISNYNISIFSTTVIEGIFLGAKPILYNIDGLPAKYFDIDKADIAIIEPEEQIKESHLLKTGIFEVVYFEKNYFDKVDETKLCF